MKIAFFVALLLAGCNYQDRDKVGTDNAKPVSEVPSVGKTWIHSKNEDALHAKSSDVFVLEGKYLSVPQYHKTPKLVAFCSNAKAEQLRLDTGVALKVENYLSFPMEKRLDGKFERNSWSVFDSREDLSVSPDEFKKILHSHKAIFGVSTIWGEQAVMEFDMADPVNMTSACGLNDTE